MKAVILAAGKGTRLKGVVDKIPKPMIKYNGKPIIEHNVMLCKKFGISEIFINTHHFSDVITEFLGDGSKYGLRIEYSYEHELLGTSGALNNFYPFIKGEPFFVLYGDNISDFPLEKLKNALEKTNTIGIIGFHYREDVSHSGVAEFDKNDRILKFFEKPKEGVTTSKWVNAGVYYLSPKIFDFIPKGFSDFAKDIFPHLLKENIPLFGVKEKVDLKAFDTPEMLQKNI